MRDITFTPSSSLQHVARYLHLIPPDKFVPRQYFLLASALHSSSQPLHILNGVKAPPPVGLRYGGRFMQTNVIYGPTPRDRSRADGRIDTSCPVCRRPLLHRAPVRPYCSTLCQLAIHLFINDLLAITRSQTHMRYFDPASKSMGAFRLSHMLRLVPPNAMPPSLWPLREAHYHDIVPWYLTGLFADDFGLNFGSSLWIHPLAIRRALRRHLKATEMSLDPNAPHIPSTEEPAASAPSAPAIDHAAPAAHAVPTITSAPSALAPQSATVPAPPSPPGAIELASLHNPVARRMAEVVLSHLETANDFLSTTISKPRGPSATKRSPSDPPMRTAHWNKEQVQLFLGLLNRTIPSVSASINLSATPETKDPSEMSREELEEAARKARLIGPGAPRVSEASDDGTQSRKQEVAG